MLAGPPKILLVALAVLQAAVLAAAQSGAGTLTPAGCVCPDECDCDVLHETINCAGRNLQAIPTTINSCSWPGIIKIDLSENAIRHVPGFAFSNLLKLERLYLYDNNIETLDPDAFNGLASLQYLYLDSNELRELHENIFSELRSLLRLYLYSNHVSSLPVGVFSNLRNLYRLALHNNELTVLDARSFSGLSSLQQLYLADNLIVGLSNSPFYALSNLQYLDLNNNRLTRLTQLDFVGVYGMLTLKLSNNLISVIEDDTFLLYQDLQELFLAENQISRVTRPTFAGLVSLVKLHLAGNLIYHISEGAFFRNRRLFELQLSRNLLQSLSFQMFAGLQSLSALWLDNNRLTGLQDGIFRMCPQLQQLILNGNRIKCVESNTLIGLPQLLYLDLGQNELHFLPENLFKNTPNLYYLLLYGNNFTEITNRPFRNLRNLVQLALQYNAISYIAEEALDGTDSLYYLQWNFDTNFSIDNRLVCDCSARWFYRYLLRQTFSPFTSVLCSDPPQYRSQDITTVRDDSFECESLSVTSVQVDAGPSCDNHVITRGGCLRLMCTSTPRSSITWSRVDNQPIVRSPHSCTEDSPCTNERGDEELVIGHVDERHMGTYMCTASLLNVTTAITCRVTIGDPPRLLSSPDDQFMPYPGEPASFHVLVSGQPRPSVEWYLDTGTGYPKPIEENERFIISATGSLIIMDTQLEDQGTYHAIFSNGAGVLSVEAILEFYFTTPCRQTCQNGGTCYRVHYCYCQENYLGRYCENYVGLGPSTQSPSTPSPDGDYDYSGSGYGSTSGDYHYDDGANLSDEEDKDRRFRRYRSGQDDSLRSHTAAGTDDHVMSSLPRYLEGEQFKSLLWELSVEERHFENKLRASRELRDMRKKEKAKKQENVGAETREGADERMERAKKQESVAAETREGRDEEVERRKMDRGELGLGNKEDLHEKREMEEVFEEREFGIESEYLKPNSEKSEVEWSLDQRNFLLELGLAMEWNGDHPSVGYKGAEEGDTPVIMGLKLLPANPLKYTNEATDVAKSSLDMHAD